MTTLTKYRISLTGLAIGGVIVAANILQAYTGIRFLFTITPPIFLAGCALILTFGIPTYYYRSRLSTRDDKLI